jgi:PAS domain S-box-containing protein
MHIEGELYVLAAIRDISERVAADERDRGIRRALDIVEDGVFMFHADTLRFHYVNAGAVHQVGYTRDELLEMTPLHIQPEYDEITFRALLEPLVSEEQPSIRFTTMHRRCDGVDIPVEIVLQSPPPVRDGERRSCVALCREVGERLRQDAELARLHLQTALLEDRERIARAMHDNVIGRLFGTGLALEATIDRSTDEAVQARLREAVTQIDATIGEVRAAVLNDDGGAILGRNVSDEVLALVAELHPALGFEPTVELHGLVNELDDPIVAHLLATLREALTNISRHAKANAAQVSLDVDEHELRLRVVDDGVGITPAASPTTGIGHHGLRNIVARATELGGRATTASPPGGGTTIEWSVPLRFDQD